MKVSLFIFMFLLSYFIAEINPTLNAQTRNPNKSAKKVEAKAKPVDSEMTNEQSSIDEEQIKIELENKRRLKIEKARQEDITPIINDLFNTSQERREVTLDFIQQLPDPRLISSLIKVLETDEVSTVRRDAAVALFSIGDYENEYKDEIIIAFQKAMNDKSITVRYTVSKLLIKFGDYQKPVKELATIFKKEDFLFQKDDEYWINNEVCRPDLPYEKQKEIAIQKKNRMPKNALDLLVTVSNSQVKDILNSCSMSDDPWVKSNAKDALKKLGL